MKPMRARLAGVLVVTLMFPIASIRPEVVAQEPAPLANARLHHVAIATKDVDRTLKAFADLLGVDVPQIRAVALDTPDNRKVPLKVAFLNTANFQIEIDQPTGPGPAQAYLDRFGTGIQHIGFTVNEPLERPVREMERRGGRLTVGSASGRFAFLDFMPTLGLTIELVQQSAAPAPSSAGAAAIARPAALASRNVSHVGLVYRDAQPAVNSLADLLGAKAPALNVFTPIDYLPGVNADPGAHVKYTMLQAGGIAIEVIEPVGAPSPWADFVALRKGGAAAHHVAFTFSPQDNLDAAVRDLKSRGGVWQTGQRGVEGEKTGSSPEFEFMDTLGLVIELTGSAR